MKTTTLSTTLAAAFIATAFTAAPAAAQAETIVICKAALATPATAAGCAGVGLLLHEALAKKPFGENGEGMKVVKSVGKRLERIRKKGLFR